MTQHNKEPSGMKSASMAELQEFSSRMPIAKTVSSLFLFWSNCPCSWTLVVLPPGLFTCLATPAL